MPPSAEPTESIRSYLDDIRSQPDLLADRFSPIEDAVRSGLEGTSSRDWDRIVVAGCGDSQFAAHAARLAMQRFSGLPVTSTTSMDGARYLSPFMDRRTVVFAISVSGEATRTVECMTLAAAAGAQTVGVTSKPSSRLGRAAASVINTAAPPAKSHGPDARTFMMSLVTLYLTALWIGQTRGHLDDATAEHWRATLGRLSSIMTDTLRRVEAAAEGIAAEIVDSPAYVAVGAGPNHGTALFTAAKILEGSGDFAWGQDAEEWAHLEYWIRTPTMPTILYVAPGLAYRRTLEQAETMRRAGRRSIVVAEPDDPAAAIGWRTLSVGSGAPEVFSPLVHAIAGELLSYHLVVAKGLSEYAVTRDDNTEGPSNNIRGGVLEPSVDVLRASLPVIG